MPATYKITLHTDHASGVNEFINVFGYHDQLALPVAMSELVNHFISDVLPDLAAIVQINGYFVRVECEQVIGGSNYIDHILSTPIEGTRTGEYLPNFNAWGFQFVRANRGERSGSKRIGPISETDVSSGTASGSIVALLSAAATAMQDPIQVGLVDTWFPVILSRPVAPSTTWSFHDLAAVRYMRVTTQNTRKR